MLTQDWTVYFQTMTEKAGIVAWWGAVLSTIVLLWDIYKWRTAGPKLRVVAQSGLEGINMPELDGKILFSIDVTNYGDRPTTITSVCLMHYSSLLSRVRKRADRTFLLPIPNRGQ